MGPKSSKPRGSPPCMSGGGRRPLQLILEKATTRGWGTFEAISAMEEVLKHLRLMYADHPHPNEDPKDSNEGHAFIHGRGGLEKP
jgi:hypothetical protein